MKTRCNPLIFLLTILTLTSLSCSLVTRTLKPGDEATPTATIVVNEVPSTEAPTEVPPTKAPTETKEVPTEIPATESAPTESAPTETPTESPVPTEATEKPQDDLPSDGETFQNEEGGYAFAPVADWEVKDDAGETQMIAADGDEDNGPAIMFMGQAVDADATVDEMYDGVVAGLEEDDMILSEPVDIEIDGVDAIRVAFSGTSPDDVEIAGVLVMAMATPRQSFAMMGFAPADVWESEVAAIFEDVLASVEFSELETTASDELVRSWASAGEATSEFGTTGWSAQQAAGAPNTLTCGDQGTAWAAAESDSVESITLYYYDTPLVPTEINIVQSYNPSQVVKVEVLDPDGEYEAIVYEAEPKATDECPYTLSIPVTDIDYLVMGVRITIDQSVLGLGWNEIDAVELVGYPEAGSEPEPTSKPTSKATPKPTSAASSSSDDAWKDLKSLPVYPSANTVTYTEDMALSYIINDAERQEVLDYIFEELEKLGWVLDIDEDGKCRDADRCTSQWMDLDYEAEDNTMWFLIYPDSEDAMMTLMLTESSGMIIVAMALVIE